MRGFEKDSRSRPPLVPSSASADAQFKHWVSQNAYRQLEDAAGGLWELSLQLEQVPHPEHLILPLYRLHISLSSQIDQESLLKGGILSAKSDGRLLQLIGTDKFRVWVEAEIVEAGSMDSLRSDFAHYISKLRMTLRRQDLTQTKRRLVASWVNKKSLFGHALLEENLDKINLDV